MYCLDRRGDGCPTVVALEVPLHINHEKKTLLKWSKQTLDHQRLRCHSLGGTPVHSIAANRSASSTSKPSIVAKSSAAADVVFPQTPIRSPLIERVLGTETKKTPKKIPLVVQLKTPLYLPPENAPEVKVLTAKKKPHLNVNTVADRFIPSRAAMDRDCGYFKLMRSVSTSDIDEHFAGISYERNMSEALGLSGVESSKILHFKQNAPLSATDARDAIWPLYNSNNVARGNGGGSVTKATNLRAIPQHPDRILDAPDLVDDYYLNLISWSSTNLLALALASTVYLWNAGNGSIVELCDLDSQEEYVSSVSWMADGNVLAVGNSQGIVQLWDINKQKLIRSMLGHVSRVGSLSWNAHIVSSGCRSGAIHNHDVRIQRHEVASLQSHSQEVCGLQWSPNGQYLASGGNDNILNIWEAVAIGEPTPLHSFNQHQAAVKAIAWCPWQSNILVSGGGAADRYIRLWNINTGVCLRGIDTNSQVSSILWSQNHHELISGHGYTQNQLTIWKYPSMTKCTELLGHTSRVLGLVMSPDGSTVASIAGDETLRLWKCFEVDQRQRKRSEARKGSSSGMLAKGMLR